MSPPGTAEPGMPHRSTGNSGTRHAAGEPREALKILDVSVRAEQILRAHYPDVAAVAPEVRATATAMATHALEIVTPAAWVRRVAIRGIDGARVELDGGSMFTSATLVALLRGSSAVKLFVVTLGPGL